MEAQGEHVEHEPRDSRIALTVRQFMNPGA